MTSLDPVLLGYGSHLPVLVHYFGRTDGEVLEVGAGYWSTPLLARMCAQRRLRLVSVEPDAGLRAELSADRIVRETVEWEPDGIPNCYRYGLAFVDCAPRSKRASVVEYLRGLPGVWSVGIVVVHDTEHIDEADPALHAALSAFKYRRDWTERLPHTTAVSDVVEV